MVLPNTSDSIQAKLLTFFTCRLNSIFQIQSLSQSLLTWASEILQTPWICMSVSLFVCPFFKGSAMDFIRFFNGVHDPKC